MVKRIILILPLMLSVLPFTGCHLADELSPITLENPPHAFSVLIEIIPHDSDNYVQVLPIERVTDQGILETGDLGEISYSVHMYGLYSYNVSRMVTKVRYIAIPGPEYRFDHWDFSPEDKYKDSFVFTNNSDAQWKAYFVPIPSWELPKEEPGSSPSDWETPEEPTSNPADGETPEEPGSSPSDWEAQETTHIDFTVSGQCTASQSGCICTVSYSIDARDLSADDKYPVTNVKLEVNDGTGWQVWHDSGTISTPEYHYADQETGVDCDKSFDVRATATNSIGQSVASTGSFTTAR